MKGAGRLLTTAHDIARGNGYPSGTDCLQGPFKVGANKGMSDPFTLLEFDGLVPDLLYLDAGRESELITGYDPRIVEYEEDFEGLLGRALSTVESIPFIREVTQDLS